MKLIEFKCKNCGAILKVDPNSDEIKCEHCLSLFKLDDEIKHLKVDDAEKIGYEFEKGRIRAQEEKNVNMPNNYSQPQKKKNNTVWIVLAWIFLLPFTASNRKNFDKFCLANNIIIKPLMEIGNDLIVEECAQSGLGVGLVVREYVQKKLDNKELFELNMSFKFEPKELVCLVDPSRKNNKIVNKFIEILK